MGALALSSLASGRSVSLRPCPRRASSSSCSPLAASIASFCFNSSASSSNFLRSRSCRLVSLSSSSLYALPLSLLFPFFCLLQVFDVSLPFLLLTAYAFLLFPLPIVYVFLLSLPLPSFFLPQVVYVFLPFLLLSSVFILLTFVVFLQTLVAFLPPILILCLFAKAFPFPQQ